MRAQRGIIHRKVSPRASLRCSVSGPEIITTRDLTLVPYRADRSIAVDMPPKTFLLCGFFFCIVRAPATQGTAKWRNWVKSWQKNRRIHYNGTSDSGSFDERQMYSITSADTSVQHARCKAKRRVDVNASEPRFFICNFNVKFAIDYK